jgi:hypothetical protein
MTGTDLFFEMVNFVAGFVAAKVFALIFLGAVAAFGLGAGFLVAGFFFAVVFTAVFLFVAFLALAMFDSVIRVSTRFFPVERRSLRDDFSCF